MNLFKLIHFIFILGFSITLVCIPLGLYYGVKMAKATINLIERSHVRIG